MNGDKIQFAYDNFISDNIACPIINHYFVTNPNNQTIPSCLSQAQQSKNQFYMYIDKSCKSQSYIYQFYIKAEALGGSTLYKYTEINIL